MPKQKQRRQTSDFEAMRRRLGTTVRARRTDRGLDLETAAVRAGISSWTWGEVERGRFVPNLGIIDAIAAVLECSVLDLFLSVNTPSDGSGFAAGNRWFQQIAAELRERGVPLDLDDMNHLDLALSI